MKLNKKGYMLIEIILASAIAFGIGYFILQMVINLKNKNDDLLVETLTTTDQTIIMNKLMEYAQKNDTDFCDKLTISGKVIKYGDDVIDIVNDYADVGEKSCSYTDGNISVSIPLSVKQLKDKKYDANFYSWKKINVDTSASTDIVEVESEMYTIIFNCGSQDTESRNTTWMGESGWNKFEVSSDQEFTIPQNVCKLNTNGSLNYAWKIIGNNGSVTRYDNGQTGVKYSDLVDNLRDDFKNNKRAVFYPLF